MTASGLASHYILHTKYKYARMYLKMGLETKHFIIFISLTNTLPLFQNKGNKVNVAFQLCTQSRLHTKAYHSVSCTLLSGKNTCYRTLVRNRKIAAIIKLFFQTCIYTISVKNIITRPCYISLIFQICSACMQMFSSSRSTIFRLTCACCLPQKQFMRATTIAQTMAVAF